MRKSRVAPITSWHAAASDAGHFLYCITEVGTEKSGPSKVGVAENVYQRRCNLQTGNWRDLVIVWAVRLPDRVWAESAERICLSRFSRVNSEWVQAAPPEILSTILRLMPDDLAIKRLA